MRRWSTARTPATRKYFQMQRGNVGSIAFSRLARTWR